MDLYLLVWCSRRWQVFCFKGLNMYVLFVIKFFKVNLATKRSPEHLKLFWWTGKFRNLCCKAPLRFFGYVVQAGGEYICDPLPFRVRLKVLVWRYLCAGFRVLVGFSDSIGFFCRRWQLLTSTILVNTMNNLASSENKATYSPFVHSNRENFQSSLSVTYVPKFLS